MTYENAQYVKDRYTGVVFCISVLIDDQFSFVPLDPANTDYQNIMALVAEGKLVIQPAD